MQIVQQSSNEKMSPEQWERVKCVLCGRGDARVFMQGGGPAQLVQCQKDGLLYKSPRPTQTYIATLFRDRYVRPGNVEWFTAARREVLRREAEVIKKLKDSGNLLDVGCATGIFFENFKDGNWQLYGVDPSLLGTDVARSEHGVEVFCGALHDAHYPDKFFDVVSVLDTLYYVPDPLAELREIRRILRDNGILAVEIPGYNYTLLRRGKLLSRFLDRGSGISLADSANLYYFSPKTLARVFASAGFDLLEMIPEQASLSRKGLPRFLNEAHFAFSKLLFKLTGARISFAGKELHLAQKGEGEDL